MAEYITKCDPQDSHPFSIDEKRTRFHDELDPNLSVSWTPIREEFGSRFVRQFAVLALRYLPSLI
jgi:hypothetical protein